MNRRIAIFDTSLFCCWLNVPGRERTGSGSSAWNSARVSALVENELREGSIIVLPLATIIETGNLIAQSPGDRFLCAMEFAKHLRQAAQSKTPWAAFTDQAVLWQTENLLLLADKWPQLAVQKLSLGDATIKSIADYYATAGYAVTILTADEQLRTHQPVGPTEKPRRRL